MATAICGRDERETLDRLKAINRAKLWDSSHHINRDDLPTYGEMLVDHCEGLTQAESDKQGAEMARRGMY